MTNLSADIARKRQEAESLPSVEDWIKAGGQVQFPNSEPRQDKTMGGFNNTGKL